MGGMGSHIKSMFGGGGAPAPSGDFSDPNNLNANVATMNPGPAQPSTPWLKTKAGRQTMGALAGGIRGLGASQQQAAQVTPPTPYNAPVMPYVAPPQMNSNFFGA